MSRRQAAEVFGVGEATVYRYLKRNREGELSAKSPPGRPCRLNDGGQQHLLAQLKAEPDLTLREHAELYAKDNHVVLAASTVDSYFRRLGVRRKKTLQARERDDEAQERWLEAALESDPDKLVFLDETGGWLGMTQLYGRVLDGARVYDKAPKRRKGKVSLLAAVTNQGINPQACLIHEGSVDSAAFLSYVKHALVPTLQAGQVVIMDNFTIHHNAKVKELIEAAGCKLRYLPTYSPDFNPIDNLFAKIKAYIRKLRPDTVHDLIKAFEDAVSSITPTNAANVFGHCGYQ